MRSTLFALVVLSLSLLACSKDDKPAASSGPKSDSEFVAAKAAAGTANGRCPVLPDELVDKDAPTRTYKDPATGKEQKIGFCCSKCPKDFDKNPEKFMKVMRDDPARFVYTPP